MASEPTCHGASAGASCPPIQLRFPRFLPAAVLLIASAAWAQAPAERVAPAAPGTRISIDAKDTDVQEVLRWVSDQTGVNIVAGPEVTGKVTVKLVDVPWEQVIHTVAEQAGCVVEVPDKFLYRVSKPPRITFHAAEANLVSVVDLIALQSGANVVVSPDVRQEQKKVSIRLKGVPWDKALTIIVETAGYRVVEEPEHHLWRIVKPEALAQQLSTRVFKLRYVQPPSPYEAKIDTEVTIGDVKAPSGDMSKDFTLFKAVQNIMSPQGKMEFDRVSSSLVVMETVPKLQEIERIIKQMDVEPKQVHVSVKFVTTTNDDLFKWGADWTGGGKTAPQVGLSGGSSATTFPFYWLQKGIKGLDQLTIYKDADGVYRRGAGPSPDDLTALAPEYALGKLDFTGLNMMLQFVKQDERSQLQQAPSLLTLDNHAATIFVGDTIRFAEFTTESTETGSTTGVEEATNSPVSTGLQMLIIPHIIEDSDQIILTIIPELVELSGPHDGFDEYTSGEGDTLRLPRVRSTTVATRLKLDSAETAVIGGLWDERQGHNEYKIPLLGDIPILGWFFKFKHRATTRSSLLIFITVHIVDRAQEANEVVAEQVAFKDRGMKPMADLDEHMELRENMLIGEKVRQAGPDFISAKFYQFELKK